MGKIVLAVTCLVVLSGCADQRAAEKKAAFDAAVAQCRAPFPKRVGNYAARARCLGDMRLQFYPNDPLEPVMRPLDMSLATKMDRGEISIEDAELQHGRTLFELRQELARTGAIVATGLGAEMQGQAAMLNATKVPMGPLPVNTICNQIGTTTYCNSH